MVVNTESNEANDLKVKASVETFLNYLKTPAKLPEETLQELLDHSDWSEKKFLLWLLRAAAEISFASLGKKSGVIVSNVYRFLRAVNERFFDETSEFWRNARKLHNTLKRAYQNAWLNITKAELSVKALNNIVPCLVSEVFPKVPEPFAFADFLFKVFNFQDETMALALEGILELMIKHNFEYPKLYEYVYSHTSTSIWYTPHKLKYLNCLDTMLRSTHIPDYVAAGFAKKIARSCLMAPLDMQEPLIALVANLQIRYPNLSCLTDRSKPALSTDPYLEDVSLFECKALESSLWEIKTLQKHWCERVAKRATFIERKPEKMESLVRTKSLDDMKSDFLAKSAAWLRRINADDDEDSNEDDQSEDPYQAHLQKRKMKGGKKNGKRARPGDEIQLNSDRPTANSGLNWDLVGIMSFTRKGSKDGEMTDLRADAGFRPLVLPSDD
ncbi:unnamed protein product, partial [Mesorhabditis spiculigera]